MTDEAALRELLAAFNAHDLDRIMAFFADDCVLESPGGPDEWGTRFSGRDAVREGLAGRFAGIPDVQYGDDVHWVCGEHAVSKSLEDREIDRHLHGVDHEQLGTTRWRVLPLCS